MTKYIEVRAPFDGELIDTIAASTEADIEHALEAAYALYRNRDGWLPKPKRIAILRRAAEIITARREDIAAQAAHEGGKPLKDSLIEVDRGVEGIELCIEELRTQGGRVVPMSVNAASTGRVAFTQHEPIGVVIGISAFNHPFNLVVHQIAPAVAVGAPVIIKPAPTTPLSCRTLIDIFSEAGLPDGWAQMVLPDEVELASKLAADSRVGFLSFIGSAAVGWLLRSKLAPGARCALEHGGMAPVIISQDADLDMALPRLARGAFFHAGQACVSVQRVFAHSLIADEVANRLADLADQLITGDPRLPETDVGPLISHREVDRVAFWVDEAIAEGAKVVTGGRRLSTSTYKNTILLNPSLNSKVMQKEIFGPVANVFAYDSLDTAISLANNVPYSFQAAAFTKSLDTAMRCYDRLDATAVMVNETSLFRIDGMPFSGARASGLGVGGIPYTMRDMQTEKMMVWRSDVLR